MNIYIYIYISIYICVCVCVLTYTYKCVCVRVCVPERIRVSQRLACLRHAWKSHERFIIYMYIYIYVYVYIYIYIYIYTCVYIYMYIHTYISLRHDWESHKRMVKISLKSRLERNKEKKRKVKCSRQFAIDLKKNNRGVRIVAPSQRS